MDKRIPGVTEKQHQQTELPYKRQKGEPLGKDEKEYNRALSRIRVKVENVTRRLEISRILRERYRNKRRGYGIKFNIIAGIVNPKMGYRESPIGADASDAPDLQIRTFAVGLFILHRLQIDYHKHQKYSEY